MKAPDLPDNESDRLSELHRLDVLDTPAEEVFDDLTRLASMMCGTLFSTVSIIDEDRQWFKSAQGPLGVTETTRDLSFCGHAILDDDLFIIEDALKDERFADNPLVTGGPMVRFYAGVPVRTPDGYAIGTLCVFDPKPRSLTDEQKEGLVLLAKQVEDRLQNRITKTIADNLHDILRHANAHVILYDPTHERINYVDADLSRILGGAHDKCARTFFAQLFPDLAYDRFFTPERLNDGELAQRKVTRASLPGKPNGSGELKLLSTGQNGLHNVILLYRDNTELSRTRESAVEAQTNLRVFYNLAKQSKNPFIVTDPEGRIEWVNASFETKTGYQQSEIIGQRPGDFLQGKDTSPRDKARISQHLKARKPVVQEILNYTKSGTPYWNEIYIEPIFDQSGKLTHYAATQANITQRKEENLLLRESRAEAERANRAKSQFLAKISHELRTPLNGIVGITEKLMTEAPEALKDTVNTLDQSSQHLMTLLDDLLDLSHIESGQLQLDRRPFDPAGLMDEICQLFQPRANMVGNDLSIEISGSLPARVRGDETRLRQVLINLVNNAVKFTREGQVKLLAQSLPANEVGFCRLRFSVSDTGPGIAEEHQTRIFESFEQLDNSLTRTYGGSGLGLAISKQIIEAMDGEILLDSQLGQGSAFSFTLDFPLVEATDKTEPVGPVASSDARTGALHALVIDDNDVNCTVLVDLLRRLGISRVYSAQSARRGLAILENVQPDILFIDIQMPGMNGFSLLEYLRNRFRDEGRQVPLTVACTAEVSDQKRLECLAAGFDAHLGKPVTGSSLGRLLKRLGMEPGNQHQPNELTAPTKTAPPPKEALKPGRQIDAQNLIDKFLGNHDLLKEFLMLLVENLPDHTTRIREAIKTGTVTAHSEAAHSIKGLVGYFEDENLKEQANALELAMKAGKFDLTNDIFSTVDRATKSLISEARNILKTLDKLQKL